MSQQIIGPLPSERQKTLVIGLLTQRKITGKDLQADHVGAMNADELTEWLKLKLNPIPTNEQRSLPTHPFHHAQQPANSKRELDREAGDSRHPHDEQPTPLRGTLPPITAGRTNEDGTSVFDDEQ